MYSRHSVKMVNVGKGNIHTMFNRVNASGKYVGKRSKVTKGVYSSSCGNSIEETDFTCFIKKIKNDEISDVYITPSSNTLTYSVKDDTNEIVIHDKVNVVLSEQLLQDMVTNDVNIHVQSNYTKDVSVFLNMVIPLVIIPVIILFFSRLFSSSGGMNPGGNNTNLEFDEDKETGVKFEDIAGIDEVIYEVNEYVDFLKNPEKYKEAGAQIPAGCLLYGQPGTGKTMIAKAIAGEAGVPFISCSASQFIELFVGMGASRIRKLFENARRNRPCIIFIDEIDAIGKKRGGGSSLTGANDERDQTLNQLLTEMDGFNDNNGIVVIAATNRLDTLDDALVRPGRFDRKINVPLPNTTARKKIIAVYMNNKKFADEIDIDLIALKTSGCSGADIKNILNEAAITSVRNNTDSITDDDVEYAIEKESIGLSRKINYDSKQKERIAIHELGHAITGYYMDEFDDVGKISILPIGEAGGITTFIPRGDDMNLYTYIYLKQKIMVALGGHACEEIFFGKDNVSTGAVSDFRQVTNIAYSLVRDFGYSETVGKLYANTDYTSEYTKRVIDKEVRNIVDLCYNETKQLLSENKEKIIELRDILIEKETMNGSYLKDLLT